MRFLVLFFAFGLLTTGLRASDQQSGKNGPAPSATDEIQTETIKIPEYLQAPPRSMANQSGYMEPDQTHQLLAKVWQAEARVKDLATQVHPEKLKMPPAMLAGFNGNLDLLRSSLDALEKSRRMFDGRVDSEYLGFETYAGISEVLSSLERLTSMVSRINNPSLEAEFNQAWNDMLTLQRSLKPYLSFLLRNHDRIFVTMESNLAGCQNQLGYKDYNVNGAPKNMRNVLPNFKGRRVQKKPDNSESAPKAKP